MPDDRIAELFTSAGKRRYLQQYAERMRPIIERIDSSLAGGGVDLAHDLRGWWEPLLAGADVICAGINGRMAIDFEDGPDGAIVVDFQERTVSPWERDEVTYHFTFPRAIVADCVAKRRENWNCDLLLSFRFQERSKGPYNKYLFAFLSALSEERIRYVESFYRHEAHCHDGGQPFFHVKLGGREHVVQKRCPHSSGDLERFLEYDEAAEILTCTLHGWRWRLDGACETADGHRLYVQPVEQVSPMRNVRRQCADCAYRLRPPDLAAVNDRTAAPLVASASSTEG
jgi:UDP-MurNAc hydroxylase